jgi:hypothetical protein
MTKNLTNFECVACGKKDCDIEDRTGRLSFCSDECADNIKVITQACSNALERFRDLKADIRRAENDIQEMTALMNSWGELFNALDGYCDDANEDERLASFEIRVAK